LVPVGIIYAVLFALVLLGFALDVSNHLAQAIWFVFFLAPFTGLYCIPFGLGVGILSQRLVWYTPRYGHRLVAACAGLMFVAMLIAWGGGFFEGYDIVYLLAILWPTFASAAAMLVGMYYIRAEEYEEAARLADELGEGDEYDDYDEAYEDEYEDEYDETYGDAYDDEAAYDEGAYVEEYAEGDEYATPEDDYELVETETPDVTVDLASASPDDAAPAEAAAVADGAAPADVADEPADYPMGQGMMADTFGNVRPLHMREM
jgi:hypothetical protein